MLITEQIKEIRNFLFNDASIMLNILEQETVYSKKYNQMEKLFYTLFKTTIFYLFPLSYTFHEYGTNRLQLNFLNEKLKDHVFNMIYFFFIIIFYRVLIQLSEVFGLWIIFTYLFFCVVLLLSLLCCSQLQNNILNPNNIENLDDLISGATISDFSKQFLLENKNFFLFKKVTLSSLFNFRTLIAWSSKTNDLLNFSSFITIDIQDMKLKNVNRVHTGINNFFVHQPDLHNNTNQYQISFLFNITDLNSSEKKGIINSLSPLVQSFFEQEYCYEEVNQKFDNEIAFIFKGKYHEFLLTKKLNSSNPKSMTHKVITKVKI